MLPSDLARRYMPELRRMRVTPADLYMFDLAATARWADLRREADERARDGHGGQSGHGGQRGQHAPPSLARPAHPTAVHQAVHETGDRLAIQGTEIPPWDARYKSKSHR